MRISPREGLGDSGRGLTRLAWVCAIALLFLGAVLGVHNEDAFRKEQAHQADAQARILASSLTAALAFDDHPAMQNYVQALHADQRIATAAVYGTDGRRLVVLDPAVRPAPERVGTQGARWSGARVVATRAATERGQVLGYVYIETRPQTPGELFARHAGVGLLTVMSLLLLVLVSAAATKLEVRARELRHANASLTREMAARTEAEEALRQSQKMEALGQLTGGIAHDFNNLLQVMMGALELIRRKARETARVEAWAANALEAGERGAKLTRQLLAFSRTERLQLTPFVVADLVNGMSDMLRSTLGAAIDLKLDLGGDRAQVLSDRTQLELAVLNLAINARDAMPNGGVLTIKTEIVAIGAGDSVLPPDDYVALSVADTGEGMPKSVIDRAFDPFFTTKTVGKGTGLGLSQVYGVARQAGGEARIESAPGAGTRVTVLLRRSASAVEGLEVASTSPPALEPPPGATVLVVDDDDHVRALVRDTLELLGYRVLDVNNGPDALLLLAREKPDALLLDFAMPQMNGAEVADRAREFWPDLPIVFASGHADTAAIKASVGPAAEVLRKPYQMDALASVLGGLVKV